MKLVKAKLGANPPDTFRHSSILALVRNMVTAEKRYRDSPTFARFGCGLATVASTRGLAMTLRNGRTDYPKGFVVSQPHLGAVRRQLSCERLNDERARTTACQAKPDIR